MLNLHPKTITNYKKQMKKTYNRPATTAVCLQDEHHMLAASDPNGLGATISGYESANPSTDGDGFE